ncbi:MAG: PD40 domain-containing protein [Alphaproteobacteria bacterium]|nr:PD40 domain-containing protein [Alphaproteobacteria bacterium]MDE2109940.1 PD40 domain-containing protein [Alphaproteobacteria bacterium]MDE2496093.1 PD40 domain-containing protein [Alphaproteobacteria bacterium]
MKIQGWQCAALLLGLFAAVSQAQADDGHTLMRFPTLHGDMVVFEAHGNLWEVPRSGGTASRLTADAGYDQMPRFSPDGNWIAFTAQYQGNQDVYVIPASGGTAKRLTFHSDVVDKAPTRWGPDNMVVTWTPDSKNIVFLSRRMAWNSWYGRLFEVPVTGGLPTPLPLDRGGLMTYSPDGKSIAYNRIFRNFRTWKRYDGGLAQDVYTYNFDTKKLDRITDWKGTDTAPMWVGRKIYFLSDRDEHRRENIWVYDLDTKAFKEVTHFTDYDIDFPSLGDNGIVFQQGGSLWVLDLPSEQLHQLDVTVPDDGTRTAPRYVEAAKFVRDVDTAQQTDYALSPNGKRALFSARGDLFTVPAEHGATRDLTDTSNADEDHPSWSPDGKTVAYTTDIDGEQEIAIRPSNGGGEKLVTHVKTGFFYTPMWSPDGKRLAISDGNHRLWLLDIGSGKLTSVAQDPYNEIHDQAFSPDGRWLAYSVTAANQQRGIWLYDIDADKATRVSGSMANDFNPVFSPNGKYLYFVSTRHENPTFSETEFNIATEKMSGIYVATLSKSEASPFAPRSDEGAFEAKKDGKSEPWKPGASKPIKIDLEGLMARAVPVPIPAADIASLDARGGDIYYMTTGPQMIAGPLPGEKPALHVYEMKQRKDHLLVEDLDNYSLSADGTKVLYKKTAKNPDGTDSFEIVDAAPPKGDDKPKPKALDISHMRMRVAPTEEWAEMFNTAWRLQRDLFINPKMNGVDWQKVHDAYAKLLPLVGSREDLNYLIGEIQGELGNSHTYVGGGDDDDPTKAVPTALLGVDFALNTASGRYYFEKIYPGDNTRPAYRSPLTEPGVDVRQGDYLLAVDGHELRAPTNPYSLFVGLGEEPVVLTVSDSSGGKRRDVTVQPIKNELSVREKAWIDRNREVVDKASGGKIGYIYMSDMEALGMDQFIRQFYPQLDKQALIVDDRWNGGGFIDQIVLERLRRILVGMSTNREGAAMSIPQQLIDGPKVTLLNHYSASDGDIFPFYFRKYGLGPLIGTRSWGGVRGIRGYWGLLDGGYITVPEDSLYGRESEWVIENHGVDPDVTVTTEPGQLLAGHDAQLQAAIDYLMDKLKQHPGGQPQPPAHLPAYPPDGQIPPPSL